MVLGVPTLAQIFEEKHYEDLDGGILEALGRLLGGPGEALRLPVAERESGEIVTAETFRVPADLRHLYAYLLENGHRRWRTYPRR